MYLATLWGTFTLTSKILSLAARSFDLELLGILFS